MVNKRELVKFVGCIPKEFQIKSIETHAISHALKTNLEKIGCNVILLN